MSGSILAGSKERRFAATFVSLLLLAAPLLAPHRVAAEVGPEDTPPIISNGVVTPSTVPYTGDQVRIDVDVEDDFGVFMAYAAVYGPEGILENILLIPSKISETGVATYSGIFNAPPNYTDSAVSYGVEVQATDTNGGIDFELIGGFEVGAQPSGNLALEPGSISFGAVKLGQRAVHSLALENSAAKSSAPIEGTILVSGNAFSLNGGSHFRLKPGQSKSYRVEFRPSAPGLQTGTVTILPSDEAEPDIVVPLSGEGVAKR